MGEDNSIFGGRWRRWDRMTSGSSPKAKAAPEGAEASWGCFRAHASGPGSAQCYWGVQLPFLPRGAHIAMGRCEWNTYFPFFFPSLTTLNLQNTFQIHPLTISITTWSSSWHLLCPGSCRCPSAGSYLPLLPAQQQGALRSVIIPFSPLH